MEVNLFFEATRHSLPGPPCQGADEERKGLPAQLLAERSSMQKPRRRQQARAGGFRPLQSIAFGTGRLGVMPGQRRASAFQKRPDAAAGRPSFGAAAPLKPAGKASLASASAEAAKGAESIWGKLDDVLICQNDEACPHSIVPQDETQGTKRRG